MSRKKQLEELGREIQFLEGENILIWRKVHQKDATIEWLREKVTEARERASTRDHEVLQILTNLCGFSPTAVEQLLKVEGAAYAAIQLHLQKLNESQSVHHSPPDPVPLVPTLPG